MNAMNTIVAFQTINSTTSLQEELAASQAALDAALAEGRQHRQLLQQREAEAVELATAVEDARKQAAQVRSCHDATTTCRH